MLRAVGVGWGARVQRMLLCIHKVNIMMNSSPRGCLCNNEDFQVMYSLRACIVVAPSYGFCVCVYVWVIVLGLDEEMLGMGSNAY